MSLVYVSQQLTIYGGIFFLIIGLFGNGMSVYIFSTVRTYRTIPATFYFLIEAISKTFFLTINLLPRIITFSYGIDISRTSLVWCRLRQVFLFTSNPIAITCTCLATIDQFFVTSSNASLRGISKIKRAYQIILIVIIIWLLHSIAVYFNINISPISSACGSSNAIFTIYVPIYFIFIITVIPVSIMIIFGYLTYRNIRRTTVLAEQQADRQLIKMILMQVVLVLISNIPLAALNTYTLITSGIVKNEDRQLKEYSASLLISLVTSIYFIVCIEICKSI